jgi:hypothetical protein
MWRRFWKWLDGPTQEDYQLMDLLDAEEDLIDHQEAVRREYLWW